MAWEATRPSRGRKGVYIGTQVLLNDMYNPDLRSFRGQNESRKSSPYPYPDPLLHVRPLIENLLG